MNSYKRKPKLIAFGSKETKHLRCQSMDLIGDYEKITKISKKIEVKETRALQRHKTTKHSARKGIELNSNN
jgi:hypothetical protein